MNYVYTNLNKPINLKYLGYKTSNKYNITVVYCNIEEDLFVVLKDKYLKCNSKNSISLKEFEYYYSHNSVIAFRYKNRVPGYDIYNTWDIMEDEYIRLKGDGDYNHICFTLDNWVNLIIKESLSNV